MMKQLEKLTERISAAMAANTKKNSRAHRGLATVMACVVVFVTTYSLILPAITLGIEKAEDIGVSIDEQEPVKAADTSEDVGLIMIDGSDDFAVNDNDDPDVFIDADDGINLFDDDFAVEETGAESAEDMTESEQLSYLPVADIQTVSIQGEDYSLTVSYGVDAGIPEGAEFMVTPVDDERYSALALDIVNNEYEEDIAEQLDLVSLFDLTIKHDGHVIKPAGAVDISFDFGEEIGENQKIYAVHFRGTGEQPAETIPDGNVAAEEQSETEAGQMSDSIRMSSGKRIMRQHSSSEAMDKQDETIVETPELIHTATEGRTVSFSTGSFSYFAIVSYTVDFSYSVNGEMYDFSLPGGEKIALSDLIEVLGIIQGTNSEEKAAFDSVEDFLKEVADVEFSDESLVKVTKNEEDNDWTLESLQPFDTEESLTIIMKNGDVITVKVTDDQIKKTVISATGETYEITVTYGEYAGIPEGAELEVRELLVEDAEYADYLSRSIETLDLEEDSSRYARIFDISIVDEMGIKVTLSSPVEVQICLMDVGTDELPLNVIHFGTELEVMESAVTVEDGVETVSFETSSFSIYTVLSNTNTSNLNGKTFAIINTHTNNAVLNTMQNNNTRLQAEQVSFMGNNISGSAGQGKGVVVADKDIVLWKFTSAGNNTYYIQDPNGNYLNISDDSITVSSNPQALTVTQKGNEVRISRTVSGQTYAINDWDNSTEQGFFKGTWDNNSEHFTLYELDKVVTDPHWATRLSVADVVEKYTEANPVQNVVIYTRVWNETNNDYDYYGLDTDGNLVPVFDVGDLIGWQGEKDMEWNLTVYETGGVANGYFDLNNGKGQYLFPKAGASSILNSNTIGLRFNGLGEGTFGTTIEGWDQDAYSYVGLKIENGKVVPGIGNDSMEFFFAQTDATRLSGKLSTVDTLDTRDSIKISVYNFSDRAYMSNLIGKDDYPSNHTAQFGLVKNNLAEDPVIAELFSSKNLVQSDVSHLFLSNVYGESGYYYYNSSDNYAYLDGSNFKVYNQVGTYLNQAGGTAELHGNFFPFQDLNENNVSLLRALYDVGDGTLTPDDPRYNELLYMVNNPEYQFGMEIEADFTQAKDGLDQSGNPVKYEFTGDDDLWVYIDGVLVLDIGGIHGAISGDINFQTGEVHVYSNNSSSNYPTALQHKDTTIRAMFAEAGYSEEWLNEHFEGNTFKDYSTHTMKMYYMERGANASNLRVKFNLPVVEKGSFTVSKEVDKGQTQYSDIVFQYKAYYLENTRAMPIVPDYENESAICTGAFYVNADGTTSTTKVEVKSDGTFSLKAGERVRFQMRDDELEYYVMEYNIDTETFEKVTINGAEAQITGDKAAISTNDTIRNCGSVNYVNTPKEDVLSKLSIKKQLITDVEDPLTKFEFYVYLEDSNGNFVPYNQGTYYIMKDGKYYHFENSYPVADQEGVERTAYKSGPYGTISDIPGGFTAVIEDLMPGTHFIVTERTWDNLPIKDSSNYVFVDKVTDQASVTAITKEIAGYDIDGATTAGNTSLVTVINRPIYRLSARKVWGDSIVGENDNHGAVAVALYEKGSGDALTFIDGSLKYIVAPETTVDYFIPNENLERYVIREVSVDNSTSPVVITPVEDGKTIVIKDETVNGTKVDDTYVASYTTGEKKVVFETYSSGSDQKKYYVEIAGTGVNTDVTHSLTVREDTITNTMSKLTVDKKDMTSSSQLANAEFKLTVDDGETALAGYESLKSDNKASGNLLNEIYLSNGTYYLVETKAPSGYNVLEYKVKIVVSGDAYRIFTASTVPQSTTLISDQTQDNNMLYTFNVYNNPGVVLPSTGGPGTRIFTILGSILLAFAGILLVKRHRLALSDDHGN